MIQANDLRIGNYLHLDFTDGMVKVEDISISGVSIEEDYLMKDYYDLEPIQLTEEILLKCGYIKNINTGNYVNDISVDEVCFTKMVIEFKENIFNFCIMSNNYDCYYVKFKYLHQLQNLYYALTKTELEINL